jgi:hypothetical protein
MSDALNTEFKQFPFLKQEQAAKEKAVETGIQAKSLQESTALEEKGKALEKFSAEDKAKYEETKSLMQAPPEFKPTQENAMDLGGIFSLIATMGVALGGSGKLSSLNALNAMGGMLKGYQSGRKDLFEREQKIFDKETARIKEINDRLTKDLETYQKLRVTDKEAALVQAQQIATQNPGVVASLINSGKADVAAEMTKRHSDMIMKAREMAQKHGLGANTNKTGSGGLNGRYAFNINEATQQAGADLLNIAKMPAGTVLGTFAGMTGQGGENLFSSLSNTFARSVTDEDSRQFQQLISGFDQNMARALGGGYANSTAKAAVQAYKEQVGREGDSPLAQATFLARAKQELDILNKAFKVHPGANQGEIEQMQQLNDTINEVIPFSVQDVISASGGKAKQTIGQFAQNIVLPQIPTLENFIHKAGIANPGMSTEELTKKYNEIYNK